MAKCETCIYRRNCQFIAKHGASDITGCTAYYDESDIKREAIFRCFNDVYAIIPYEVWNEIEHDMMAAGNAGRWAAALLAIARLAEFWKAEHEVVD